MTDRDATIQISPQEERELKRVFDLLCNYHLKEKDKYTTFNSVNESANALTNPEQPDSTELAVRTTENAKKIDESQSIQTAKISVSDVYEMLRDLKQKVTRKEVEEMIWECDEDLDSNLNWSEFRLMFTRNVADRTGLEPSRMFNLTQFLIYDRDRNGYVSVDETMNHLYARYGRAKMEVKLKELFGENMPETGRAGGGEIDFNAYLDAVERIQMQTFLSTTKGRMIAAKTSGKKTVAGAAGNFPQLTDQAR